MTVREAKVERLGAAAVRVTWSGLKTGDVGEITSECLYQDRSIQVKGVFGTGRIALKGSNCGEEFVALTDPRGNDLVAMSPKIEQIEDCSFALRPEVVGGDETTDLTVVLFARKAD